MGMLMRRHRESDYFAPEEQAPELLPENVVLEGTLNDLRVLVAECEDVSLLHELYDLECENKDRVGAREALLGRIDELVEAQAAGEAEDPEEANEGEPDEAAAE